MEGRDEGAEQFKTTPSEKVSCGTYRCALGRRAVPEQLDSRFLGGKKESHSDDFGEQCLTRVLPVKNAFSKRHFFF